MFYFANSKSLIYTFYRVHINGEFNLKFIK